MRKQLCRALTVVALIAPLVPGVASAASGDKYAIVFKNTGNPYGDRQMGGFKQGIEEQGAQAILRAPVGVAGTLRQMQQLGNRAGRLDQALFDEAVGEARTP